MKTITTTLFILLMAQLVTAQEYFGTNTFGAGGIENIINSAVDSNGNVYSAGLYSGTISVGTETITWKGGNIDAFMSFHDSEGNPLGVQGFGGPLDGAAVDVAVDSDDYIFVTGYFMGAGPNAFDADPSSEEFLLEQLSPIASRDCFIIKLDSNREFVNAWQISNPFGGGANEDAQTIEVDSEGNIYVAGSFVLADFDPDPDDEETIFSIDDGATSDGFLVKLDNNGDFIWVKTYQGAGGNITVEDMEFDVDGNIVLTGSFGNEIDLDTDETNTDTFSTNGGDDIFVTKVDTDGNYIWGATFGGSGLDLVDTVRNLSSGIYLGGAFSGTVDLDPGTGMTEVTSNGDLDAFYSVLDTDGNFQGAYSTGGEGAQNIERINSIAEDSNGMVYAAGVFIGTADLDSGAGSETATSNGETDLFYVVNSPELTYDSHWTLGGSDIENNPHIRFNADGDILTFGAFRSSDMDFNPLDGEDVQDTNGFSDIFFSRYRFATLNVPENQLMDITAFPNPFTNQISVSNTEFVESYQLHSVTGRLIQQGVFNKSIDVSALAQGVYMLTLNGQENSTTLKMIKR